MLTSRGDRGRDLVSLRGTEQKNYPRWRLFNGLQQRVKCLARDLVCFVNDENLVAVPGRLVADVFTQFTHFVDTAIGRGIDLDHIHGAAGGDFQATCAGATGLNDRTLNAIETARQNARQSCLPGAPLPRKDVPVCDAPALDRILECSLDVLLVHHVAKRLRPVFASNYLVHGAGTCQAPGDPRHTNRTTTVASFRTWRGLWPSVARSPRPDKLPSYHPEGFPANIDTCLRVCITKFAAELR